MEPTYIVEFDLKYCKMLGISRVYRKFTVSHIGLY